MKGEAIMQMRNQYYFLSNMYPCKITYSGHTFKSSESAFQAQKDLSRVAEFEPLEGRESKRLGRKVKMRPDWESVKLDIMKEILKVKFSDPDLAKKLIAVKEPIVEENTWHDTFWGVCDGKGQNHLGKLLTEIREELMIAQKGRSTMANNTINNATINAENKEVNAMNNTTNASNQSTQSESEVKALSFEAAVILSQLMAEAQGDKTYKVLFKSDKYKGVLLAKRSNLLAFAKKVLPKSPEEEVKNALNELFKAGALFYRNLDRGCLIGMRQQEWSRARELLLAAVDAAKGTHEELTDKNIAFEGEVPIG